MPHQVSAPKLTTSTDFGIAGPLDYYRARFAPINAPF
jgi:hypothetical protein